MRFPLISMCRIERVFSQWPEWREKLTRVLGLRPGSHPVLRLKVAAVITNPLSCPLLQVIAIDSPSLWPQLAGKSLSLELKVTSHKFYSFHSKKKQVGAVQGAEAGKMSTWGTTCSSDVVHR